MSTDQSLQKASKYYRLSLIRELIPDHRSADCLRIIKYGRNSVDIMHNPDKMTARFAGVCACGNGWVCPVCAARLSEKKAQALKDGLQAHPEIHPMLATFTMQHHQGTPLKQTITQLKSAYQHMITSRAFRDFAIEYDWKSSITSTEVTYGQNGWHPHFHTLALITTSHDEIQADAMRIQLSNLWQLALKANNAYANDKNGTTLKNERYTIAEYVAKFGHEPEDLSDRNTWGIERELAKAISKNARVQESFSPQALLSASQGERSSKPGALFAEFANATFGLKQITISKKAKEMLAIDLPESDTRLVESADLAELLLARLSRDQWKATLYPVDRRSELIALASTGQIDEVDKFVQSLEIVQKKSERAILT